jgi:transcriptional regulator with XRE-family HTH domain
MAFKDVLKELRINRGLTQDDLSKGTGLAKSTISMYENGNREPNFETLELFADFFNVDMNTLFEHNSQNISYYLNPETAKLAQAIHDDPDLRILLDASRDLEPEDIKFVVDLVKKLKLKERGDHAD